MNTTELFVEQVLAGLLAIVVVMLPWAPEIHPLFMKLSEGELAISGAAALGFAYLLGTAIERLADSLLENLDAHHRLRFALRDRGKEPAPHPDPDPDVKTCDVFDEARLRVLTLGGTDAAAGWMQYLRSRVRLSRVLAVLCPGLTFSAVLLVTRVGSPPAERCRPEWIGIVPAVYLVALAIGVYRQAFEHDNNRWLSPAPKTTADKTVLDNYKVSQRLMNSTGAKPPFRAMFSLWLREPTIWLLVFIHAAAVVVSFDTALSAAFSIACAGFLVTVIAAWSWWRISTSFRSYLEKFERHTATTARHDQPRECS